jgi:hypothetical protein
LRQGPAPGGGAEPLATDPELLVAWLRGWDGNVAEGEAVLALAQSATPEQRTAWAKASEVLAAEPASRLLADLIRLVQGAPAAEVCESINGYAEAESSGGLRLAAKVLTTHGQPGAARRWITEVHRRQEGNPLDDTGLILDICQAESDQGGMADWRDRLPRFPGPSSRFIDLAAEFIRVGQRDLALGLMADRYRSFRVLTEEQRYFLNTYAGHLIREGALEQARQVLLAMFQKTVGGDPSLLVDYYKAAGKLDQLEGELDKYYLSKPERERVLSLVPPGMKGQGRPVPQTSAIR